MSITTFAAAFAAEWESGIKVFGTQITSDNVSDLMSLFKDSDAEGTVTYDHATQTLTLDHCTLMAHPTSIFGDLSEFNMVNCYFKQPADAVYNPDKHRVEINGNELANMDVQISASDKQGIEEVGIQPSAVSGQKVLRDGMLLIERNGKTYNAQGAEVK